MAVSNFLKITYIVIMREKEHFKCVVVTSQSILFHSKQNSMYFFIQ